VELRLPETCRVAVSLRVLKTATMNDRVKQFLRDIERNQYAVDAWGLVIRELQGKRIEEVRPVYENAVNVFPTSGRFWKLYIEHEVRNYCISVSLFGNAVSFISL
jgi:cleavage stimulation factor subunit 3